MQGGLKCVDRIQFSRLRAALKPEDSLVVSPYRVLSDHFGFKTRIIVLNIFWVTATGLCQVIELIAYISNEPEQIAHVDRFFNLIGTGSESKACE